MAEERLIDDDKDRKYKIRKNENGEDELVIDGLPEEEDREEIAFEVPDLESDDEEAAVMTPEQLAARDKAREEAENKLNKSVYSFGLVTIGENSVISSGVKVGKNTAISGVTEKEDYPDGLLAGGESIIKAGDIV